MLDLLEATITKEACDMCYCKIKVDGNKERDVSFVKHNNTTHLNEHKKKDFGPKERWDQELSEQGKHLKNPCNLLSKYISI